MAQPCDWERRPIGRATSIGSITNCADTSLVRAWLQAGLPDDGTLPDRPLAAAPPHAVAHLNRRRPNRPRP